MSDIRVTFVLPTDAANESDASEAMIQAYESCKHLVDNISWAKESDLVTINFTKLDYVVFENFEGKDFSKLIKSKCAVVGPLAVSVCLMEGKPIPSFQWPILNVAMYGCQVTCSQISKNAKEAVKDKVQLMGGLYTGNFTSSVTHLICNGTRSEKYVLAAERGVKLMIPDWIDHIFEASKLSNINANDPKFLKKYTCPPFYNSVICTTGITSSKEKAKLSEIISANGGRMTAKLVLSETDILVCHGIAGTTSDKYKAARKHRLTCVTLDWIYDSVEKGHALPVEKYYVRAVTSTPTKEGENVDPNFSTISCIGTSTMQRSTIDETANSTQLSTAVTVGRTLEVSSKRKASEDLVEELDIKKVKSAGQFLDGCSVLVVGFSPERREKLNKVVNLSGATRYDNFSERVTHIIVGDPNCYDVTLIKAKRPLCALVSVEWLRDSVEQQRPAKEDVYLITHKDFDDDAEQAKMGSPLSKKALSLLKSTNITVTHKKDETKLPEPSGEHDDPLTQHYLKNATSEKDEEDTLAMLLKNQNETTMSKKDSPSDDFQCRTRSFRHKPSAADGDKNDELVFNPHETSTQVSQVTTDCSKDDTDVLPVFSSYTFYLDGFSEEDTYECMEYITGAGGTIVDKHFKGVTDYAVVPIFSEAENLPAVKEIVNNLWIIQSLEEDSPCDIQYFHRPIGMPSSKPLENCVVTISVYTGQERNFLNFVIAGLGGIFQEQFSRKNIAAKNVLESTHLVSPEAGGKKYEAAQKWNIPVVNKDWLLECARTGTKVDVQQYLIGDTSVTNNSSKNNVSKKNTSSSNDSKQDKDKEVLREVSPEETNKLSNQRKSEKSNQKETGGRNSTPQRMIQIADHDSDVSVTNNSSKNNDSTKNISSSNNSKQDKDKEVLREVSPEETKKSSNQRKSGQSNQKETGDVSTPQRRIQISDHDMKTPIQQIYNINQTPDACSQVTPVNVVLQQFNAIHGKILPTPSPKVYEPWDPKTPDTPIGAFIRPNPSPRLRKEMQKYINSFPDFVPPPKRRLSTPLSELKRRLRNKVLGIGEYAPNSQDEAGPSTQEQYQHLSGESQTGQKESTDINARGDDHDLGSDEEEPPIVNVAVHQKLQELQQRVMANGSASASRRSSKMFEASTNPPGIVTTNNEIQSQVCTVGWDYGEADTETQPQKIFLLSGIELSQREKVSQQLRSLGGEVLEANAYDVTCTHLICPKPGRNEKTLACMAAGKWILHLSFVEKSIKAGKFLDEEEFEFGNSRARKNISFEEKDCSVHFWRKEIKKRGYGAFHDMRAIVVAEKKEPITNVIEAGGGVVVHVTPPFNDSIHATHCLLEMKMVKDFSKYIPLAEQGVKCVNTIYINDFLWRIKKDDSDYILPYFSSYY